MGGYDAQVTAVSAEVAEAAAAAVRWLTRFCAPRIEAFDPETLILSLLGLGCAFRILPPKQMEGAAEVAQRIGEAVAQSLGVPAGEVRAWFHAGGAVTALMAAAMQPSESEPSLALRKACVGEWSTLVRRDVLLPSSTAWRIGSHLQQLLTGGAPPGAGGGPAPLPAA